jgi:Flp pilus assembly pilin Flp
VTKTVDREEVGAMSESRDTTTIAGAIQRANAKPKGASTTEYAVMLVLVAIAMLVFGPTLSSAVTGAFSTITSSL